jgi:hypothetical protein
VAAVWAENLEEAREKLLAEHGSDILCSLWNEDGTEQLDDIGPKFKADRAERAQRLVGQEDVVKQIERLLFRADPIGINFEENTDEYRPEAETITLRLPEAANDRDLLRIIHEEFVRWFGDDTAGPMDRYGPIASEIWSLTKGQTAR